MEQVSAAKPYSLWHFVMVAPANEYGVCGVGSKRKELERMDKYGG